LTIIAVPAWRIGVSVAGRILEYCVDAYFVSRVDRAFRRILLVYPATECKPAPSPGALTVSGGVESPSDLLEMIREGCGEAWRVSSRPRRTGLIRFILAPHPEDLVRAEARSARELCTNVFADLEDGYRSASLAGSARSFIEYPIGDTKSHAWRRLRGLARIDSGVAAALEEILSRA
jgi:hypothetical protein